MKKLFLVKLRYPLGEHYVIAKNPTAAYKKVRKEYDAENYGSSKAREMESITLIADSDPFSGGFNGGFRLWL